jgi:cyclopropane-fatty-acyl-phospholipid synthase
MGTLLRVREDRAARVLHRLVRRLVDRGLALRLRLWDGTEWGPDDRGYRLVLTAPWSLRALLVPPTELQAGETYLAGGVDVEGSMVAALRDVARIRGAADRRLRAELLAAVAALPPPPSEPPRRRVSLAGALHGRDRDAAAIRHHYDVGNDFYRLVLDRDLVYSCAYFVDADLEAPVGDRTVLDRAQQRKLNLICRKLALQPGERFLDVGCGWGSLVLHAARTYGVRALGVTLSVSQAALGRERIARAGLDDRVRIELRDYRDVDERFDAIASVGMVEHVGAGELTHYARHLWDRLREGGRLLNHGITTGGRGEVRDFGAQPQTFVGRHVFPDAALVPAHTMVRHLEAAGFEIQDVEQLRRHYTRTLEHWVANLEAHADEARRRVGDRTYRIWRVYMAGSALGFEVDDLGVIQVLGTRGPVLLPLTRDRLLRTDPASPPAPSPDVQPSPARSVAAATSISAGSPGVGTHGSRMPSSS